MLRKLVGFMFWIRLLASKTNALRAGSHEGVRLATFLLKDNIQLALILSKGDPKHIVDWVAVKELKLSYHNGYI